MSVDAGDGRDVPKSLFTAPGSFIQLGANRSLQEVVAGTPGQVPTYQADGTLAAANAGGGGGSTTSFVADVTPGNSSPTRSGLQDFDDITGVDGLVVFVFGGGGGNRIASGLWIMHSDAWTRPATGWSDGTALTDYEITVKSGTIYKNTHWTIGRGTVLGTDQQFWASTIRTQGNPNPPAGVGAVLVGQSEKYEYTELAHPGVAGKVLTSNGAGIQPSWNTKTTVTHAVTLQTPSPLTISGSPANVTFGNYNGYNAVTGNPEANNSAVFSWNGTDSITLQPGLYSFGVTLSAAVLTTDSQLFLSLPNIDIAGVVVPNTYSAPVLASLGSGSIAITGLINPLVATTFSMSVLASVDVDLSNAVFSFVSLT